MGTDRPVEPVVHGDADCPSRAAASARPGGPERLSIASADVHDPGAMDSAELGGESPCFAHLLDEHPD